KPAARVCAIGGESTGLEFADKRTRRPSRLCDANGKRSIDVTLRSKSWLKRSRFSAKVESNWDETSTTSCLRVFCCINVRKASSCAEFARNISTIRQQYKPHAIAMIGLRNLKELADAGRRSNCLPLIPATRGRTEKIIPKMSTDEAIQGCCAK